jgi:hypothetical protein
MYCITLETYSILNHCLFTVCSVMKINLFSSDLLLSCATEQLVKEQHSFALLPPRLGHVITTVRPPSNVRISVALEVVLMPLWAENTGGFYTVFWGGGGAALWFRKYCCRV